MIRLTAYRREGHEAIAYRIVGGGSRRIRDRPPNVLRVRACGTGPVANRAARSAYSRAQGVRE